MRLAVMLLAAALPAAAEIVAVDGGKTDCYGGFDVLSGATSCEDGNPQCDADGFRNGECVFQIRACVGVRGIRGCHPGRIRRVYAKAYQSRPPTHVSRPTIPALGRN